MKGVLAKTVYMYAARLIVVCVAVASLAACNRELKPADVVLNEDACAQCRMAVSQIKFAAQVVEPGGMPFFYDDIGCMFIDIATGARKTGYAAFVADFETSAWIPACDAFYVKSSAVKSPMGYGIAAFAAKEACERYAAGIETSALTYDEVAQHMAAESVYGSDGSAEGSVE